MFRIVARESRRARTMPRRSPFTSVTPALSIATSVPVPIAMPTSARRQRGRVVDAVAGHGHHAALGLEAADDLGLLLGQDLGVHLVDAELARHRPRGGRAVAGEHDDAEAVRLELANRLARGRLDRDRPRRGGPRPRRPRRRTPRSGPPRAAPRPARRARRASTPSSSSRRALPSADAAPVDLAGHPLPGERAKRVDARPAPRRARRAPATIAAASGCSLPRSSARGEAQERPPRSCSAAATHRDEARLALGERARLVHDQRVDLLEASRAPRRA